MSAITHRTPAGAWEACVAAECKLRFHLPGFTPAELRMMSDALLMPLLEVIDPPSTAIGEGRFWRDAAGEPHRDYDLPAIIRPTGSFWYRHGQIHREQGPAQMCTDGTLVWSQYNKPHRDGDLPAAIHADGTRWWYQNGLQHRDGEPAVMYADGTVEWWHHGNRITPEAVSV